MRPAPSTGSAVERWLEELDLGYKLDRLAVQRY